MAGIERYDYWEHRTDKLEKAKFNNGLQPKSKHFGTSKDKYCFQISSPDPNTYGLQAGFYIGVDWLVENHTAIVVAPKLDTRRETVVQEENDNPDIELDDEPKEQPTAKEPVSVDYHAMLRLCLDTDYLYKEIDDLVHIDWMAKEVPIPQSQDWLSPLLIVKFLNVLKAIVRKGLKKSYYQTTKSLTGKIKGKILVGQNIKQNVLKNRLTQALCRYEEFGIDSLENRLLNKAFGFAHSYLDNNKNLFGNNKTHFAELVAFCRPAFESVGNKVKVSDIKNYKPNPFFKEYKEGIQLAKLILKRYAYTIANTAKKEITTPPYWIDMPKLFELYVYGFLKKKYPKAKELTYHLTTYGNELDFLINSGNTQMVVDAKYKPVYLYGKNHNDIRQVAGYARLRKVYKELDRKDDQLIDCLIIYPSGFLAKGESIVEFDLQVMKQIDDYVSVYKYGIKLPAFFPSTE
jgi:5-methylcytosine-specific restriction enzyme subunit McrC